MQWIILFLRFVSVLLPLTWLTQVNGQSVFSTMHFRLSLGVDGTVTGLYDLTHGAEYCAKDHPSPLISIRAGGKYFNPSSMTFDKTTGEANIRFSNGITVTVRIMQKQTHIVMEVRDVDPEGSAGLVQWGPYPTSIVQAVGEIVGVVRDDRFAIGIQALNVKTLGGTPLNEECVEPSRGRAAEKKEWGSVLQAYSIDRSSERSITVWGENFPRMPVPPVKGEKVVGSKIALFGCPENLALETIGAIEIAEGLPHPTINGVWTKVSPEFGRSYLIADYTEETVDELLGYTLHAGLMSLYHMEPFESWGHYSISNKQFPHGVEGVRKCVEKAKKLGIRLGAHTLTNFINTNDPYITPVPDDRLAVTGTSGLASDINKTATEIAVTSPEYFNNAKANWLHTVKIDKELIRYRAVSQTEPWKLLDCERGAFGTNPSHHGQTAVVGKLLDHPYNVFFPNLDLQNEIARNLALRFNETGLGQLDFDGREGCWASGQGDYAQDLFSEVFYENLDHEVLSGTSTSTHFYWHINTYCNWGEPWSGGFRESMQEYRIDNQALFERNYLPNMLGWYLLTETTSLPEMEWMLARAAGYNAGFAMATGLDALRKNKETDKLLDAIREWETARRAKAFSPEQRERMKSARNEFHLEKIANNEWDLIPFHASAEFRHEQTMHQPGEPTASVWDVANPDGEQPLQFRIQVVGDSGSISNHKMVIDNYREVQIPVRLDAGQSLVCDGSPFIRVYDTKGRQSTVVELKTPLPVLKTGKCVVVFDCGFTGVPAPVATVAFKTKGLPERVKINN